MLTTVGKRDWKINLLVKTSFLTKEEENELQKMLLQTVTSVANHATLMLTVRTKRVIYYLSNVMNARLNMTTVVLKNVRIFITYQRKNKKLIEKEKKTAIKYSKKVAHND